MAGGKANQEKEKKGGKVLEKADQRSPRDNWEESDSGTACIKRERKVKTRSELGFRGKEREKEDRRN